MLKLFVIGRLGKDAEQKEINNNSVIDFPLVHVRKHRSRDTISGTVLNNDKTTWINCSYWVNAPKLLSYLKKGTQVYLEGIPDVSAYAKGATILGSLRLKITTLELIGPRLNNNHKDNLSEGRRNEDNFLEEDEIYDNDSEIDNS